MSSVARLIDNESVSAPKVEPVAPPALRLAEPPMAKEPVVDAVPRAPARKRNILRKMGLGAALIAALAAAGWYGEHWYTVGRFVVSTDDAYVKSDMSALNAKVGGYVASIDAPEFTSVKAGDLLLRLDSGDYELAVQAAHDKIATQKAAIARIEKQTTAQQAQIAAQQAQIVMAEADAENSDAVLERQAKLVKSDFASRQTLDDAKARQKRTQAGVAEAQQMLAAAQAQADVIAAQALEAKSTLRELETAARQAERDLAFTEIRAPFDGIVANRAVEPGQYVEPGQRLMALVPANGAYIDANFKETQLAGIRLGQKADITIDALGDAHIQGTVEAIAPASGAEFSLLPPENATGNFTKITQRVPVRVKVPATAVAELRPGLSAVVSIDTRSTE